MINPSFTFCTPTIFLKYISDSFETVYKELENDPESLGPEERDEYIARRVFWVPEEARWAYIQDRAKQPEIGKIIDDAMDAIEKDNASLKGVLPKDYARPSLDKRSYRAKGQHVSFAARERKSA